MLKARVAGKFYNALDNDEPWAIQMAMRNQFGWDAGRGGFHLDTAALADERAETTVRVEFVVPGKQPRYLDEPVDVPGFSGRPIPGQKLLPAPPRLRKNEFGAWVEDE
jgi:hypothetical protein